MPTGVPANRLTASEKNALFLLIFDALVDGNIPDGVDRSDILSAHRKLQRMLNENKPAAKKPKRKVKKGSEKAE